MQENDFTIVAYEPNAWILTQFHLLCYKEIFVARASIIFFFFCPVKLFLLC